MCMGSGSSSNGGGENHGRKPTSMDRFNYFLHMEHKDPRLAETQKSFLGVTDFVSDSLGRPIPGLNDPRKQERRNIGATAGGINARRRQFVEEADRSSATLGS